MHVFDAVQTRYLHESMVDPLPKKSLFKLQFLRRAMLPLLPIETNAKV